MSDENRLRTILAAPNIDGTDVGEGFVAFKWAEALSELVDLTVLSFERPGRAALAGQLPDAKVVAWPEPAWARKHERFNAMAKPAYPVFARYVRRYMAESLGAGQRIDLAHLIMPQAARYPVPFRHFPVPYIVGPLGGGLDTPPGFASEMSHAPVYTRLRNLDSFRFRYDPALRASYTGAEIVLGVAPYMARVLSDIGLKRFEPVLELGIDALAPDVLRQPKPDCLRLLHVGRGVRTKGLRDVVRALARLKDRPGITLTSAGGGKEIELCKAEAEALGVAERVSFLGLIQREEVEDLYRSHDVFTFPSFREPAGGVLYEAMRWGLPIITVARGGPDWIIDDQSGVRLPISTPQVLAADLAEVIADLADNPSKRLALGQGARDKVAREGLW
ncbi:MAG: glycosyltransferase family 4 protein, partial [Rhodobacteraceae bacterium]|nr:glycosyltransferase family 4 protein [Paracoccaceae bacterium]